jgi:hypothetical protein
MALFLIFYDMVTFKQAGEQSILLRRLPARRPHERADRVNQKPVSFR